ncbi:MAG: hypothetical protein HY438_01660 [DPANN group archaeon]|nr:hypothetical protein [DPANN group archaeon]
MVASNSLKYFNTVPETWLQFADAASAKGHSYGSSDDGVLSPRHHIKDLQALADAFAARQFTPQQAKEYLMSVYNLTRVLLMDVNWKDVSHSRPEKLGTDDNLNGILDRYLVIGARNAARVALFLLKGVDCELEAKVVPAPKEVHFGM